MFKTKNEKLKLSYFVIILSLIFTIYTHLDEMLWVVYLSVPLLIYFSFKLLSLFNSKIKK